MEGSQAIAVRSSSDLATLDELKQILVSNQVEGQVVDDPEQISAEIVAQLLSATTDAELERVGTAEGWRDLIDVPVRLAGFRWRPSSFDEGSAVFFVVFGERLDTGEQVVLTTGARNVLAQLCNMAERGTLVGAVRAIRESDSPTRNGYRPLWLYTPEAAKADQADG